MYLEERIAILEDILHMMMSTHPELCPHSFALEYENIDEERGVIKAHYKCSLCGATEDQERKIEKPFGYFSKEKE